MAVDVEAIVEAVAKTEGESLVEPIQFQTNRQNQLLAFFKPEVFCVAAPEQVARVLEAALDTFGRFDIQTGGCAVLAGEHLAEARTMDRHYGAINRLSRLGSEVIPGSDQDAIRGSLDVDTRVPILGGHELLEKYSTFNATFLNDLWSQRPSRRLRSGLYYESYEVHGETVVLVNGFHPAQLEHYTAPDRRLAVLLLCSDLPWRVLRQRVIGDTYPEKALPGSIRRQYFDSAGELGLGEVTIANNCVHLSAGPFEALFEMRNFFGDSREVDFELMDTRLGVLAEKNGVSETDLGVALENPTTVLNGEEVGLFDATEDCDAIASLELLRVAFGIGGFKTSETNR